MPPRTVQLASQTLRGSITSTRRVMEADAFSFRYGAALCLARRGYGAEAPLSQALDPIPQGEEILMSYFPISLPRSERQQRLQNDYGFSCRRVHTCLVLPTFPEACIHTAASAARSKAREPPVWQLKGTRAYPAAMGTAATAPRTGSKAARATTWSTRCGCSSFCAPRRTAAARWHRPLPRPS